MASVVSLAEFHYHRRRREASPEKLLEQRLAFQNSEASGAVLLEEWEAAVHHTKPDGTLLNHAQMMRRLQHALTLRGRP